MFPCTDVEIFRVRYRYGFPAAEETRHRGRDTGQTPKGVQQLFQCMTISP